MDTHWFDLTKKKVRQHAGTTVRILGSAVLFATVLAPMPAQQPTTEAGSLSWSDTRPLLTSNEDTSSSGGFDPLPAFGSRDARDNGGRERRHLRGRRQSSRSSAPADDGATCTGQRLGRSSAPPMAAHGAPGDRPAAPRGRWR